MPSHLVILSLSFFCCCSVVVIVKFTFYSYPCSNLATFATLPAVNIFSPFPLGVFFHAFSTQFSALPSRISLLSTKWFQNKHICCVCVYTISFALFLVLAVYQVTFLLILFLFFILTQDCSIQQINDIRSIKWKIRKRKISGFALWNTFYGESEWVFSEFFLLHEWYHFCYEMHPGIEREIGKNGVYNIIFIDLPWENFAPFPLFRVSMSHFDRKALFRFVCMCVYFSQKTLFRTPME